MLLCLFSLFLFPPPLCIVGATKLRLHSAALTFFAYLLQYFVYFGYFWYPSGVNLLATLVITGTRQGKNFRTLSFLCRERCFQVDLCVASNTVTVSFLPFSTIVFGTGRISTSLRLRILIIGAMSSKHIPSQGGQTHLWYDIFLISRFLVSLTSTLRFLYSSKLSR